MLKHKDDWPILLHAAKRENLRDDQLVFLLALREVEDGEEGDEFKISSAKGTNLATQTKWAISSIKANEMRWQDYVRDQSRLDFLTFFATYGGPMRQGWHHRQEINKFLTKMKFTMKEIENGIKSDPRMG